LVAENRKAMGLPVSSETQVGEAWAECKPDALVWLAVSGKGGRWTEVELAKIQKSYADVSGIVLPGERAFQGRHAPPRRIGTDRRNRRIRQILRPDNVARHP